MCLLFNDLIYTLIYKERVTVPTKCTAPLSITFYSASKATKSFTGNSIQVTAKVIHMLELPKHFSDIFYPSCLYNPSSVSVRLSVRTVCRSTAC